MMKAYSLVDLSQFLQATFKGQASYQITKIAPLDKAGPDDISFVSNTKFRDKLIDCKAGILIVKSDDVTYCNNQSNLIIVEDPYIAYAKIAQLMDITPNSSEGIHSSATIASDVNLGSNVSIGANTVIESGVTLADNVSIGAGCFIGKNSCIGANTKIWANVSIYHNVEIGKNCLIQSSAVIGSDGFGYANDKGKWIKIPQLGGVRIGNCVEIGACTCIDRGALDDTIIEDNVIIDNLCQIAHNVHIGYGTAVAGGVIMAGSLTVGKYCLIGGASVINGHMEICDGVTITGMGMVMRPITEPGVYSSGIPLQTNKEWRKTAALTMKISDMNQRLKALEKQN